MKPILLLQSRPEDDVCDNEFQAISTIGEIEPSRVQRLRMERDELFEVNLDDYEAIIMGGGPANFANEQTDKSPDQLRYESWLIDLMKRIIIADKPFLGMCLGIGTVSMALGVKPSFDFGEPVVPMEITLNDTVQTDPLLSGLPNKFFALVGHKEGIGQVSSGAIELARSSSCVQMLRCGDNVYATQFHPELDLEGLSIRVEAYKDHGYFEPGEARALVELAAGADISHASTVLKNFVNRYIFD